MLVLFVCYGLVMWRRAALGIVHPGVLVFVGIGLIKFCGCTIGIQWFRDDRGMIFFHSMRNKLNWDQIAGVNIGHISAVTIGSSSNERAGKEPTFPSHYT